MGVRGAPRRAASARQRGKEPRYGVIGLGAGSLACHAASGETWRFFEIDPRSSASPSRTQFTYLTNCQPQGRHRARRRAPDASPRRRTRASTCSIVDAFSSDAIPMHLLTAEAIALYATKLKPDGRRRAAHLQPLSRSRSRAGANHPQVAGPAGARDRGPTRTTATPSPARPSSFSARACRPSTRFAAFRARETCMKARSGPGPTIPPISWGPSCPSTASGC